MTSFVRQQGYLYYCVQELHQEGYTIAESCDILELNRSKYYKWLYRTKSSIELENEAPLHEIRFIYAEHNGTYGYRLIADEYNATHKSNIISNDFQAHSYCWFTCCNSQETPCISALHS